MPAAPGLILHVCCAPCLAAARAALRHITPAEFPPLAGMFFYNPNIHPLLEFRKREKALRLYLERDPLPEEIVAEYGLRDFLARIAAGGGIPEDRRERCRRCYRMRLEKTAEFAAGNGADAISTTLLASREQDRELVAEVGREAAEKFGLAFAEADMRRILSEDGMLRGIYRQQYCGCIFSEEERYRDGNRQLYRNKHLANRLKY
ncbi:MAG: epoxyqueuosine reductase QueH [Planctomycetes bacterium]|nr:epoxyqueuosine reductase QueH [Planctomycetota bacterium]